MMREIVLDTETTGLDPAQGHRIVEIGAVELVNHVPTGRTYQAYINPERDMPAEAEAIHGLGNSFLKDKPVFGDIAEAFNGFIADAQLVIHNASFDTMFINAEFSYLGRSPIVGELVIDTLALARQKYPNTSNSLDALCRRYGIDNTRRTKHGALLDAELLSEVYIELIGGRQTVMALATADLPRTAATSQARTARARRAPLAPRLTEEERAEHAKFVRDLSQQPMWKLPET